MDGAHAEQCLQPLLRTDTAINAMTDNALDGMLFPDTVLRLL